MPAKDAGDQEGVALVSGAVDADGLGAQGRIAAGAQAHAERREDELPQGGDGGAGDRQREIVEDLGRRGPGRGPDAEDAVVAAGDAVPLEDHRPGDLGEGQGQHGEVDAGQPHAEPAEDQRRHAGQRRPGDGRRLPSAGRAGWLPAPHHRRRGRSRRRDRTTPCRPRPSGSAGWRRTARRSAPRSSPPAHSCRRTPAGSPAPAPGRRRCRAGRGSSAAAAGPTAPPASRAGASARPSSPHGRTTSTTAITRKASTRLIPGKTTMPKALSSPSSTAAR